MNNVDDLTYINVVLVNGMNDDGGEVVVLLLVVYILDVITV